MPAVKPRKGREEGVRTTDGLPVAAEALLAPTLEAALFVCAHAVRMARVGPLALVNVNAHAVGAEFVAFVAVTRGVGR